MKKIAIAGLCTYSNYGDQFIGKCVDYLVRDADETIETVFISFEREKSGFSYYLSGAMQRFSKFLPGTFGHKFKYAALKIRMKKYFHKLLSDCDGLVFACGSFKYGTQNLWAMYSLCVECCEDLGIPVMFDAMNIQKYSEKDWRCQCLKKHANFSCVKMITSRDGDVGVQRLKDDYIFNEKIELYPVGDPAFWISECYKYERNCESEVIGINVIRGDTFQNYGGSLTKDAVAKVYADLISNLENNGFVWELFTNGLSKDLELVKAIEDKLDCRISCVKVPNNDVELVDIISNYKCVLGARLHACICSYALGIPVVGFIWDEKLIHFAEEAKIEDCFCSETEFSGDNLFSKILNAKDSVCDEENKTVWKNRTANTIKKFLVEYC